MGWNYHLHFEGEKTEWPAQFISRVRTRKKSAGMQPRAFSRRLHALMISRILFLMQLVQQISPKVPSLSLWNSYRIKFNPQHTCKILSKLQKSKYWRMGWSPRAPFPTIAAPTPYLSRQHGRGTPEWWDGGGLGQDFESLLAWGESSEPGHLDIRPKRRQREETQER